MVLTVRLFCKKLDRLPYSDGVLARDRDLAMNQVCIPLVPIHFPSPEAGVAAEFHMRGEIPGPCIYIQLYTLRGFRMGFH
jgi:hypothetical protein